VSDYIQIIVVGGKDRTPYTNRTHTWIHMTVVVTVRNRFLLKMLIIYVYPLKINPAFEETTVHFQSVQTISVILPDSSVYAVRKGSYNCWGLN
jgi:hypothetical protein